LDQILIFVVGFSFRVDKKRLAKVFAGIDLVGGKIPHETARSRNSWRRTLPCQWIPRVLTGDDFHRVDQDLGPFPMFSEKMSSWVQNDAS